MNRQLQRQCAHKYKQVYLLLATLCCFHSFITILHLSSRLSSLLLPTPLKYEELMTCLPVYCVS